MQEITIEARGLQFPALVDGPKDGPLVVMLHGLPRNRWEWHHQIPSVAALGHHVVAPDLRGFSHGARPEGQSQGRRGLARGSSAARSRRAGA